MKRVLGLVLAGLIGVGTLFSGVGVVDFFQKDAVYADDVQIDYDTFPDTEFNLYIRDVVDQNKDYQLSNEEISKVDHIDIIGLGVRDLKGLEIFYNLVSLLCDHNQLTSLDVSNNPALEVLHCDYNQLTSLDVSNNPALKDLDCRINQLTSLDVSNNPALESVSCFSQYREIRVKNNTIKLSELDPNIKPECLIFVDDKIVDDKIIGEIGDIIEYDYLVSNDRISTDLDVKLEIIENIQDDEPEDSEITGFKISPHSLEIAEGRYKVIYDFYEPESAYITHKTTWDSADPSIAEVDDDGYVTGLKAGTTTITATSEDGEFTDTCKVTVKEMLEIPFNLTAGDYRDGMDHDFTDTCFYTDAYFDDDASTFNYSLATASLCLELSSFSSNVGRDSKNDREFIK